MSRRARVDHVAADARRPWPEVRSELLATLAPSAAGGAVTVAALLVDHAAGLRIVEVVCRPPRGAA